MDGPTAIGALTLLILAGQLYVFWRQANIMDRQASIMEKQEDVYRGQLAIQQRQESQARDEAIGTYYRLAFDLASELSKADGASPLGNPISADFNTHPRQMLRRASRLFAPLGNGAIMALNQAGIALDRYFLAVFEFNAQLRGGTVTDQQVALNRLESERGLIGGALDLANCQIPEELRWRDEAGHNFDFRARCSDPASLPPPKR